MKNRLVSYHTEVENLEVNIVQTSTDGIKPLTVVSQPVKTVKN